MYDRMKQQQEFIMYVSYMQSYNNGLTHACPNVNKNLTSEKVDKSTKVDKNTKALDC